MSPDRQRATRPTPRRATPAAAACLAILLAVLVAGVSVTTVAAVTPVTPRVVEANAVDTPAGQRLPNPEPDPAQVRQDATDIVNRPEYQEPPPSVWDRIMTWIGDRISDLFRTFSGGTGGGFAWVILAILVGVGIFLLFRLRGMASLRRRSDDDDPLFVTEVEAARTPTAWLAEAERLEAEGQWKAALRCRYRALVGQLIERGVIRDVPGRTSGEFRVETRRRAPELAAPFAMASDLFDAAWYGDEPTGPVENQRFRELAQQATSTPATKVAAGSAR